DVRRQPRHVRLEGDRLPGRPARVPAGRDAIRAHRPQDAEFRRHARGGRRGAAGGRAASRGRRADRRRHRSSPEWSAVRMPNDPEAGLGGSAAHWSAQLWRFLPTDFQYRSHVIDRYGAQKLPVGNRIQDWPVTYDDLEPYYDQFEYDIGASGYGGNINGTLRQGGNIFEGPRTRDYPHPPLVRNRASEMFWNACQELGYHPFPQPSG